MADPQGTAVSAVEREKIEKLGATAQKIQTELRKQIVGMDDVIEKLLVALFCGGHCLLVGVPGLAKTLLISSLGKILSLKFARIQFTPDLMPSDITGTELIAQDHQTGKREMQFVHGPIFANLVLADEINRTPPKTQAALMEAMEERQVTTGGVKRKLEEPFYVLATQNPIEQEGTYPLPIAQLDRFMFNLVVDYPSADDEYRIASMTTSSYKANLEPLISKDEILDLLRIVRKVKVADPVLEYAAKIARATRARPDGAPESVRRYLQWGVGPRGGLCLVLAAKARAMLLGRADATAEDIRALAKPVLRHRLLTNFNADADGITPDRLVEMLIEHVPSPDGKRIIAA